MVLDNSLSNTVSKLQPSMSTRLGCSDGTYIVTYTYIQFVNRKNLFDFYNQCFPSCLKAVIDYLQTHKDNDNTREITELNTEVTVWLQSPPLCRRETRFRRLGVCQSQYTSETAYNEGTHAYLLILVKKFSDFAYNLGAALY